MSPSRIDRAQLRDTTAGAGVLCTTALLQWCTAERGMASRTLISSLCNPRAHAGSGTGGDPRLSPALTLAVHVQPINP